MNYKKKFYLFKQAKNFCAVPWNHFKVNMNGDITTCTFGTETFDNLVDNDIGNILQSSSLRNIRQDLYNDKKIKNCQVCNSYENITDHTKYHYLKDLYNPMFIKSSVNYENNQDFILSGIDLHWSSLCNLKCITCWAKQSSSIAVEQGVPVLHTANKEAEKIISFVVQNQDNLKEVYLSGGEPTLIKHNLQLLTKLNKRQELQIRINTNMMFDDDNQIINELKKFPNVIITVSADSTEEKFNYIRRGADWKILVQNIQKLQKYHFKWRINSTFFVCTAFNLLETFDFFWNQFGINDFTINQLQMDHSDIRARNLPDKIKKICQEKYLNIINNSSNDKNLVGQLVNCINELENPSSESYIPYLDGIDKKVDKNWKQIFPELIDE